MLTLDGRLVYPRDPPETACAWCRVLTRDGRPVEGPIPLRVSHGICRPCLIIQLKEL